MAKPKKNKIPLPDGIDVAEVTLEDKDLGQESSWRWLIPPKKIAAGLDRLNDGYRERTGEDLPFAKSEARFRAAILRSEREMKDLPPGT